MEQHFYYIRTVFMHKVYVFIEACKLGIPWRGLVHDLSKLSLIEWLPRVNALHKQEIDNQYRVFESIRSIRFYLIDISATSASAIAKGSAQAGFSNNISKELVMTWLHHYHKNPHHWQWWVTNLDSGELKILPMSDQYRREMLADWRAVSRMPGRQEVIPWYTQNKDHILLHPETRAWLEQQLGLYTG